MTDNLQLVADILDNMDAQSSEYSGQNGRGYCSKGDRDHGTCRIEKDSLLLIVAEDSFKNQAAGAAMGKEEENGRQ